MWGDGSAGDLLLEGYLGRKRNEVGRQAEGSRREGEKEEIKELALIPSV